MGKWTFREWLSRRLDESMTLYIQDYDRPQTLHQLGDLARSLDQRVGRPAEAKLPPEVQRASNAARPCHEVIAADDLKDWEPEGDLNFYCYGWPRDLIDRTKAGIKYFLDEMGVKYGPFREETWQHKFDRERDRFAQMGDDERDPEYPDEELRTWQQKYDQWMGHHRDFDSAGVRVVRVPILANSNRRPDMPEEINLSNDNATAIFGTVLGFPGDEGGFHDIDVNELIIRIEAYLTDGDVARGVRPATDEQEPGRARVIGGGLDEEGIHERLDRILAFAKWAKKAGFDTLYAA